MFRNFILAVCLAIALGESGAQQVGHLKVLSVRSVSDEERRHRVPDYMGNAILAVLRYESPADSGVFIYEPTVSAPTGYTLKRTGKFVRWIAIDSPEEFDKSPGLLKLKNKLGDGWIYLPPHAAIEWEFLTIPLSPDEESAKSIFVRRRADNSPNEVISEWFRLPAAGQDPTKP
jgi:hypothetical protein